MSKMLPEQELETIEQWTEGKIGTAPRFVCRLLAHVKAQDERIKELDGINDKLAEFTLHVLDETCWDNIELDGGDLQERAVKLGLIIERPITEADVKEFGENYDWYDAEIGDPWCFLEGILERAAISPDKEVQGERIKELEGERTLDVSNLALQLTLLTGRHFYKYRHLFEGSWGDFTECHSDIIDELCAEVEVKFAALSPDKEVQGE